MKLKSIISAGLTATILSTGAAYAQATAPASAEVVVMNTAIAQLPKVVNVVESLKAEGYTYIEIRRTFLGRAKIVATGPAGVREIVMSTNTNEIMRDSLRSNMVNGVQNATQSTSHPAPPPIPMPSTGMMPPATPTPPAVPMMPHS